MRRWQHCASIHPCLCCPVTLTECVNLHSSSTWHTHRWFPLSSLPPLLSSGVRRLQWALPHRGQREGCVRGVCCQLGHKPAHLHDLPHNHRCAINTNCRSVLHLNKLLTDKVMRRCNTVDTRQISGPACCRTSAEQSYKSKQEKWCAFSSLFAVTWQI